MKKLSLFFILLVIFLCSGCSKKTFMKYAERDAFKECEENFYTKFHSLVLEEEKNELRNIKTLPECKEFVEKFWRIRDTDPATPENEYKEKKEKLAKEIENEALFLNSGTSGFYFKNNGDFWGNPAKVYMLHGEPDYTEILRNGQTHVDLMLWIYFDEQGKDKYRFLFYQKNGASTFILLTPGFDIFYGLQEINKNPAFTHPLEVYDELDREGKYIFLVSLIYFSEDPSMNIDKALRPPKPASEIAKRLSPKIIGDIDEKNREIFYESITNSTIPAKISFNTNENEIIFQIETQQSNLDWKKNENNVPEAELLLKVFAQNLEDEKDVLKLEEKITVIAVSLEDIEKSSWVCTKTLQKASGNRYQVNVFLQNTLTNKYNSWIWTEEIKK